MRLCALVGVLCLVAAQEAQGAVIAVSDADFGFVGNAETAVQNVAISNGNPGSPLLISTGAVSGDADQWFSFAAPGCDRVSTCPFSPPLSVTDAPALVAVRCAPPPGSSGVRTASLAFTSNAASGSGIATLHCVAGANVVAVSPPSHVVDFGLINLRGAAFATAVVRIRNPGPSPLSADSAATLGPDSARFQIAPFVPVAIPPGGQLDIVVTYSPIAERPQADPDVATLTVAITSAVGAGSVNVALRGRGGAPHASLVSVPIFADSFTNPGPAAQILPIAIANTGEVVLALSNGNVTNAPAWKLMNPDPVEVPGGTTYSFLARFTPTAPGAAPSGVFTVNTSDAMNSTLTATLSGNGLRRNVTVVTPEIDLYYAAVGTTAKLTDVRSDDLLKVQNLDDRNDFEIREIRVVDGEGAFTVLGAANARLEAGATRSFDIAFTPPHAGAFTATALVFLDSDPEPQVSVALRGQGVFVAATGGGCSTTSGAGLAVIAATVGLLLWWRRRSQTQAVRFRSSAAAGAFALGCCAGTARADTRDLDIAVFDPTPSTSGFGFALPSPDVGRNGAWTAQALVSHAYNPLVLVADPNDNVSIANRTALVLGGAFAFAGRFELGASLPLYIQSGENLSSPTMFGERPATGTALGMLAIHGKVRTWRQRYAAGVFSTGLGLSVNLPTATDQQFAGSDSTSLRARVLASFAPSALSGRLIASVNAGAAVRATAEFHDIRKRSGAVWGIGVIYRALRNVAVAGELYGEIVPGGRRDVMGRSSELYTAEGLVGVHYSVNRYVDLGIAVSRGLASGPGAPALRGVAALTLLFAPPSPAAYLRSDDEDSDGDGISDDFDRCPDLAEDRDGVADDDGCPDPDNDDDGIPDAKDKCPKAPEDKDGFEDADGCPDPDDDGDGIRDAFDHCPRTAETINGNDDDDGCPDAGEGLVTIESDQLVVAASPEFTVKGDLAPSSFNALGQLAATLRAHPELTRIRIVAEPARARALINWLVQWGIAASRLEIGRSTSTGVRFEIVKRR